MKEKILWGIAVVGMVFGVWAFVSIPRTAKLPSGLGATAGNLLAEQYMPYVLYNGGYNSAKPIATSDTLAVTGTSALTGDVTLGGGNGALVVTTSNTATSTVQVGCISMYATSTATAVRMSFSLPSQNAATTTTQGSASIGNVVWQYGSCPI